MVASDVPHGTAVYRGSRLGAGIELAKRQFTHGITGKESIPDIGFLAIKRGISWPIRAAAQVIPGVLNLASSQEFETYREGEPGGIAWNSVRNVGGTLGRGNLPGAVSAAAFELPDLATDIPLSLADEAPYSIRAVSSNSRGSLYEKLTKPHQN